MLLATRIERGAGLCYVWVDGREEGLVDGWHVPQGVLVIVADLLEDGGGGLGGGGLSVVHGKQAQLVLYDVGDGLGVGGGAGPAAPNGVVDSGQLVSDPVGDVCTGRGSRIGT